MAEFFKKTYQHAYKRGNNVWVKGKINNFPFHRMSTGKKFKKANMNWGEKHWDTLLHEHFQKKLTYAQCLEIPTMIEFLPDSLGLSLSSASNSSVASYESIFNNHIIPVFGKKRLDEIKNRDIIAWQIMLRDEKKLSWKTITNIRAAFSAFFQNAIQSEFMEKNPIRNTKPPSKKSFAKFDEDGNQLNHKGELVDEDNPNENINPFSLDEVKTLVSAAEGQFKNILALLFYTGMRLGEMVVLKWSDINWNDNTIHIQRSKQRDGAIGLPKNGKKRKIDILPPALTALKKQYEETGLKNQWIFLNQYGDRYHDYETFRRHHWMNLLRQTGFDSRTLYQTRHTFASIMLERGEELAWISSKMLGHSEIATTLRYYSRFIKDSEKRHASFLYEDERTTNVQSSFTA